MSDYLGNLAARSLNQIEGVRPRPISLFEPLSDIDARYPHAPFIYEEIGEATTFPNELEALGIELGGQVSFHPEPEMSSHLLRTAESAARSPAHPQEISPINYPAKPNGAPNDAKKQVASSLVEPDINQNIIEQIVGLVASVPKDSADVWIPTPKLPAGPSVAKPTSSVTTGTILSQSIQQAESSQTGPTGRHSVVERIVELAVAPVDNLNQAISCSEIEEPVSEVETGTKPPTGLSVADCTSSVTTGGILPQRIQQAEGLQTGPTGRHNIIERIVELAIPMLGDNVNKATPYSDIEEPANEVEAGASTSQAAPIAHPRSIVQPNVRRYDESPPTRGAAQAEPTIQVTIGRIEVRAVQAASLPKKQAPKASVLSLEDYLRQRNGGAR